MPNITIRNLDKALVAKLRKQAAGHGRSMEESMANAFRAWFGPKHGVDLELPERGMIGEPPNIRR